MKKTTKYKGLNKNQIFFVKLREKMTFKKQYEIHKKLIDEMIADPILMQACPTCHGNGTVMVKNLYGNRGDGLVVCPRCKGASFEEI